MKLFVTPRNFYLSTFKGRDHWVKSFLTNLMPTTFFLGEPGYVIVCTVAVPKPDSVMGEEAHLKLLLAKRNSP